MKQETESKNFLEITYKKWNWKKAELSLDWPLRALDPICGQKQRWTKSAPSKSKKKSKDGCKNEVIEVQRFSIKLSAFSNGAPPQGKNPIPKPGKILSHIFVLLHS